MPKLHLISPALGAADTTTDNFASNTLRRSAAVEMEQRLLGYVLRGDPGAYDFLLKEIRSAARSFSAPHDRVLATICSALDAKRSVSPLVVATEMPDLDSEFPRGFTEYLRSLAEHAPTTISQDDTSRNMRRDMNTLRRLWGPASSPETVALVRGDTVEIQPIEWIWPGWLAASKFHIMGGQAGAGKTSLAIAVAATIANYGLFPDGSRAPVGDTLIWSGEDDFNDSILPRFMANGGARQRIHFVKGCPDEYGRVQPFDPARDVEKLIVAAKAIPELRLVIVDPIVCAVAGDSHKNAEVRRGLQPLIRLCEETRAALLGITHFSKATAGRETTERITGSLAFGAQARIVWAVAKALEPDQPRRLVRTKSNLDLDVGGFEYSLVQVLIDNDRQIYGQAVEWGNKLEGDARTLLADIESPEDPDNTSALEAAMTWLREMLGSGSVRVPYIQDAARQMGHSWATVKRAKMSLRVKSSKTGISGGWIWQMPDLANVAKMSSPEC